MVTQLAQLGTDNLLEGGEEVCVMIRLLCQDQSEKRRHVRRDFPARSVNPFAEPSSHPFRWHSPIRQIVTHLRPLDVRIR